MEKEILINNVLSLHNKKDPIKIGKFIYDNSIESERGERKFNIWKTYADKTGE